MLIALEGMDGVGKSSLSRLAARVLGGVPIVKAVHPLRHPDKAIDNFYNVSTLVLKVESEEFAKCRFGVRGAFIYYRLNDVPMVSDRFYASNLWHIERRDVDIKRLVDFVGIPERTILLYAPKDVLRQRITGRDVNDKDLEKVDMAEMAYDLMRERFGKLSIPFVEMSTEGRSMEDLAEAIAKLYSRGGDEHDLNRYRAFSFPPSSVRILSVPEDADVIDAKAFFYLKCLSSFAVHRKNRSYKSVRGVLYTRDGFVLVCYPRAREVRRFSIKAGVRALAPSAFLNGERLEEIRIPDGLLEIGSTVFFNCRSLRRIRIPFSVERVGPMNFLGCDALEEINVAFGNKSYMSDGGVLYEASGEAIIRYPTAKSAESFELDCRVVRAWAFAEARNLRQVGLGKRVESIEAYAFMNSEVEEVVVASAALCHIGERAFALCSRLRRVRILDAASRLEIHSSAFEGCDDGLKVYLPLTVFERIWEDRCKCELYKHIRSVTGTKDADESCGVAALKYLLRLFATECGERAFGGYWIFDIASVLADRLGSDRVLLRYHKSKVIDDYAAGALERDFDGRRAIEQYVGLGGIMKGGFSVRGILSNMPEGGALLMLVDNSVLHGGNATGAAHYVVVKEVRDEYAIIVNPLSSVCVEEIVPVDVLVSSCEISGGWVLSVLHKQSESVTVS